MRNSSMPKRNIVQDDNITNAEKANAKKLKQARLPFKVIAPGSSPVGSKTITTPTTTDKEKDAIIDTNSCDSRKRKLSADTDDDSANIGIQEGNNVSKENVEISVAVIKKKKLSALSNNDIASDVVSLLDEDEDDSAEDIEDNVNSLVSAAPKKNEVKTPKSSVKDKRKGAGTPQTSNAQKNKNGSATKLQIKLPLSSNKKKRRKSNFSQVQRNNSLDENSFDHSTKELSGDDIEETAAGLNPQKRKKYNNENDETKTIITECTTVGKKHEIETIALESETEEKKNITEKSEKALCRKDELKSGISKNLFEHYNKSSVTCKSIDQEESSLKSNTLVDESSGKNDIENSESSNEDEKRQNDKEDLKEIVRSDNEADDETDNLGGNHSKIASANTNKHSTSKANRAASEESKAVSSPKNLTPKQVKLMEQRRKAREEKERKLLEEKVKKQQEKEEKEMLRKREREEKEEHKRKEREEKEEQKRKEREEKERKRLAEIEAKNEEKRKKNEAKEEELRKKEEERKRKEQEKEEADLKKKKAAQAFTKFFVAKTPNSAQPKNEDDSNTGDGTKLLAFRPFQIKGDMKLAPILRKNFTAEAKSHLDDLLGYRNKADIDTNATEEVGEIVQPKNLPKFQLYLSELRSGKILPGKWRRLSTESKEDVILVDDELDRVGQEIVEDIPAYVREEMRVKFYKFHDNRRPPYYGTWRKKSSVVKPRKPFAQDKKIFDYEVDSDDEWEEEEPGESLEDGSDEDKEKESEDDDYEVDNEWFVPHGHLSEEEMQNEDELGVGDDNTREAQKAKLQLLQQEFAQEMKKKTEKIKPRLIGCIWADVNGNPPVECPKIIWDTLEKKAMLFSDAPLVEEPEADRSTEANSPSNSLNGNTERTGDKLKPISLSDNMVKDLTRLVHGNNHAKNFLINEYIAYIAKTEESVKNGGLRKPLKSVVRDKIDEIAEWQAVDATATSIQEMEHAHDDAHDKKKKKVKRRLCWVVKQEMLDKMDLSCLELKNSWEYTLPPKFIKTEKDTKIDEKATKSTSENISTSAEDNSKEKISATSQITKLAKEKTKQLANASPVTKSNSPATSKEKKRVPLLMSVARGQQISTPAKNKLISQFLQNKKNDSSNLSSPSTSSRRQNLVTSPNVEDDDVVILD